MSPEYDKRALALIFLQPQDQLVWWVANAQPEPDLLTGNIPGDSKDYGAIKAIVLSSEGGQVEVKGLESWGNGKIWKGAANMQRDKEEKYVCEMDLEFPEDVTNS